MYQGITIVTCEAGMVDVIFLGCVPGVQLLWVYYWRVLREQTLNEAQEIIDIEGGMFNERSFEKDFRNMIMRQFAVGGLLGALLYYCLKYFNFFLMTHPPS